MSDFTEDDAFEAAVPLSQRAMARPAMPYLEGLNPAQREAVETLDGPVLMLAGAGTGKTKALMTRVAYLIHKGRARSDEVLAVTFTNKAAKEMRSRLEKEPFEIKTPMKWMGTFHSVCAKLLRRHAELVGLKTNFSILDADDQLRLLKQLYQAWKIDEKRHPPRVLLYWIEARKNAAVSLEKVSAADDFEMWAERLYSNDEIGAAERAYEFKHRNPESGAVGRNIVMASEVYAAYQQRLLELNAVDFGDILLHMVTIFQTHKDVLEQYQRWFRYILVDEYQDTNVAQYLWLRL
ncbi:MAG: UvrD-helicase domain-containing protein, partial [Pseudomonadota bacterium]